MDSEKLVGARSCAPRRRDGGWRCSRWRTQPGEWFCGECGEALPPVKFKLTPSAGESAAKDAMTRHVTLECTAVGDFDAADLKDFTLNVDCTDRQEDPMELMLPVDPARREGQVQLPLKGAPVTTPFDLMVMLGHVDHPDGATPVATGNYDYSIPVIAPISQDPAKVPPERTNFELSISIVPDSSRMERATLAIDGYVTLEAQTITQSGATVRMAFAPDDGQWEALERLQGPAHGILTCEFRGVRAPCTLSLDVERLTPAKLEIHCVNDRVVRALTGRKARVGAILHNVSGSPARIQQIAWKLSNNTGAIATGTLPEFEGVTVPGLAELVHELRPSLVRGEDKDIPRGIYHIEFVVHYVDSIDGTAFPRNDRCEATLEVREQQRYSGIVCIDFGTTATAAAVMSDDNESYFLDPEEGEIPTPIELGPIIPGSRGIGDNYFTPTIAVAGNRADGQRVVYFGADVEKQGASLTHRAYYDRLKWKLGRKQPTAEPPKGTETQNPEPQSDGLPDDNPESIYQLVRGYLDHIKTLIEEHPAVAATVDEVVMTRPAKFGLGAEGLLVLAARDAGMTVDARFRSSQSVLISESWPPLFFTVPFDEGWGRPKSGRLMERFYEDGEKASKSFFDIQALNASEHYLCTFDVGGGSADISLLEVTYDKGRIRIRDLECFTDSQFAGEGFRDLVIGSFKELLPDLFKDDAIDDPAALIARRKLAEALKRFPEGPFEALRSPSATMLSKIAMLTDAGKQELYRWAMPKSDLHPERKSPNHTEAAGILSQFLGDMRGIASREDARIIEMMRKLGWAAKAEAGDFDQFRLRIALHFFDTFSEKVKHHFNTFKDHWGNAAQDRRVRVVITGRGSLFPLVDALITWHARQFGISPDLVDRILDNGAKSITSWGGATLMASKDEQDVLDFPGWDSGHFVYGINALEGTVPHQQMRRKCERFWEVTINELPADFDPLNTIFVTNHIGKDRPKHDAKLKLSKEIPAVNNVGAARAAHGDTVLRYDCDTQAFVVVGGDAKSDRREGEG